MKCLPCPPRRDLWGRVLAALLSLTAWGQAPAAPTIVSSVPANTATGVAPTAAVIITFSEAMNTSLTTADFTATNPYQEVPTTPTWSAGNTVLTCTPTPAFPASQMILWGVSGQNASGVPLTGYTGGTFTTAAGSRLALTNAAWSGTHFAFDVTSQAGTTFTVEYSTIVRTNQWQTLVTTNSPTGRVHIVDPQSTPAGNRFYRARTTS